VFRFLSRHFGISTPIDSTQGKKEFRSLAEELITPQNPGEFNQAMMEFGARQCKPVNPDCEVCPFRLSCVAFNKKLVHTLPVKEKKTKVTDRFFYYLVLQQNGFTFIRQRTGKGIWQGLFEFPVAETDKKIAPKAILKTAAWKQLQNAMKLSVQEISEEHIHILSHQKLHIRFVIAELSGKASLPEEYLRVKISELEQFAFPVILKKNISLLFNREGS
jgi:A/G-specific adenine glycosylase